MLVTDFCEGGVEENSADLPAPSLGLCVFSMFLSEHKRVYTIRVWVCVHGCSFESERAKRAAPAASIKQWKAPFSTALITVSAALLSSDKPVSTQPTKCSHT